MEVRFSLILEHDGEDGQEEKREIPLKKRKVRQRGNYVGMSETEARRQRKNDDRAKKQVMAEEERQNVTRQITDTFQTVFVKFLKELTHIQG